MVEETSNELQSYQRYMSFGAVIGIMTSICCFYFITKKLRINRVIRVLLLFASVQQFFGYVIFLISIIFHMRKMRNRLTCFFTYSSFGTTMSGTQNVITLISIIRYFLLFHPRALQWGIRNHLFQNCSWEIGKKSKKWNTYNLSSFLARCSCMLGVLVFTSLG